MSKFYDRVCIKCGDVEFNTATKSEVCIKCFRIEKNLETRAKEEALIESLGYTDIKNVGISKNNKPQWTFVHPDCGTEQTWVFGNLLKRIKADPDYIPCSKCGGKRRAQKALDGYLAKYARTYDLKLFEDYALKVRRLSDKTYAANQPLLNPHGYTRQLGNQGHHLDHRVPIIVCFFENIRVEVAASVENLELLEASKNLSKGKYDFSWALLEELKFHSLVWRSIDREDVKDDQILEAVSDDQQREHEEE